MADDPTEPPPPPKRLFGGGGQGRWEDRGGSLHRELTFADFDEAFAFMVAVAAEARDLDHHPDWSNSWNRVTIDLVSHDAGGVTDRDRELAARIDRLLAEDHGAA